MTTLQKSIIVATAAAAIVTGVYQFQQNSKLRDQVQTLQNQQAQHVALSNQLREIQQERDWATNALAAETAAQTKRPTEVLKLRGEVGRLRNENADIRSSSPLSKVTANPEAVRMLREQQKLGMKAIYRGFAQSAKLTPEQSDKLTELLADNIMENVGHVTTVLRDKPAADQMNAVFAAQEVALEEEVQALLGPEGLARYQDYTKNLLSMITTEQFKGMLAGTGAERDQKSEQMRQIMQEEVLAALASAGLPEDYQTLPILNFRNIASEQTGEGSLKLLDDIYQRFVTRGSAFLSPEDVAKFQEFKTTAINNNRASLSLNRTMMAPLAD